MPTAVSHDFSAVPLGQNLIGTAPATGLPWASAISFFPETGGFETPLVGDGVGVRGQYLVGSDGRSGAVRSAFDAPSTASFEASLFLDAPVPSAGPFWDVQVLVRGRTAGEVAGFALSFGDGSVTAVGIAQGPTFSDFSETVAPGVSFPIEIGFSLDRSSGDMSFLVDGFVIATGVGFAAAVDGVEEFDLVVFASAPFIFGESTQTPRLLSVELLSSEAVTYPSGGDGGGGGGGGTPPVGGQFIQTTFAAPGNFTRQTVSGGAGSGEVYEHRAVEVVEGLPPMTLLVLGSDLPSLTQAASVVSGNLVLQPRAFGSDSEPFVVSVLPTSAFNTFVAGTYDGPGFGVQRRIPPYSFVSGPSAVTVQCATLTQILLMFESDLEGSFYEVELTEVNSTTLSILGTNISRPSEGWVPDSMTVLPNKTVTLLNSGGGGVIVDASVNSPGPLGELKRIVMSNRQSFTPVQVAPFKISFDVATLQQFWTGFVGTYEVL